MRERRVEDIDWQNVAEEIEDLGKSERRAVDGQLARLLEHLLKLRNVRGTAREYNGKGWRLSVSSARLSINKLLRESPSLRPALTELLADAYPADRIEALHQPTFSKDDLPRECPWTVEQVLNDDFLPDAE